MVKPCNDCRAIGIIIAFWFVDPIIADMSWYYQEKDTEGWVMHFIILLWAVSLAGHQELVLSAQRFTSLTSAWAISLLFHVRFQQFDPWTQPQQKQLVKIKHFKTTMTECVREKKTLEALQNNDDSMCWGEKYFSLFIIVCFPECPKMTLYGMSWMKVKKDHIVLLSTLHTISKLWHITHLQICIIY